jgi:hypothetical protein
MRWERPRLAERMVHSSFAATMGFETEFFGSYLCDILCYLSGDPAL